MNFTLRTLDDVNGLAAYIAAQGYPVTVSVRKGVKRSDRQNRLQMKWCSELSPQLGMTPEEVRAYCKLHFGVPIRRNADEAYMAAYDRVLRPLTYEQKLSCMMAPLDFPVTRDMTVSQLTQYLDDVYQHFAGRGYTLTVPGGE